MHTSKHVSIMYRVIQPGNSKQNGSYLLVCVFLVDQWQPSSQLQLPWSHQGRSHLHQMLNWAWHTAIFSHQQVWHSCVWSYIQNDNIQNIIMSSTVYTMHAQTETHHWLYVILAIMLWHIIEVIGNTKWTLSEPVSSNGMRISMLDKFIQFSLLFYYTE